MVYYYNLLKLSMKKYLMVEFNNTKFLLNYFFGIAVWL